jgi:RimJ/RimL family protein N-acetyltransferase
MGVWGPRPQRVQGRALAFPLTLIRTARLLLRPLSAADLPDLIRLRADPMVFGQMLGGVGSPWQVAEDLAASITAWACFRTGMFAIHERSSFQGITGIHERPDGRGLALRFAVWSEARGRGVAREAASAALRFAHDEGGIQRIVAVARKDNFGSRIVLGSIGMTECDAFLRAGHVLQVYESLAAQNVN